MNIEKISLALLSFGETGMEVITAQDVEGMDIDHVGMLGNFYSNVLGAAEQSKGLFGPLPIAYRYDLLLFLYAFNAYDPNLKDERVIRNNNITRASVLLFFPTSFDSVFSSQRKNISTIFDQWAELFLTFDIRKTSLEKLNQLKEKIIVQIVSVTTKTDFNDAGLKNLVKIIGKHFSLLETVAYLYQKPISIKFLTNSEKLNPIIKRSILYENIDTLVTYSKQKDLLLFALRNIKIEIILLEGTSKNFISQIKGNYHGIFLFYDFIEDAANSESFNLIVKNILDLSPKDAKIMYCIETYLAKDFQFETSEIPSFLANQLDRSISLVDLRSKNSNLEGAIIDFAEKLLSNF